MKYPRQDVVITSVDEGIIIGEIVNTMVPRKAVIPVKQLLQHTIILGATGSGKTFTCSRIVERAEKYSRIIIDWHGEYSNLINGVEINPYDYPINPFTRDLAETIEVLIDAIGLTHPQAYILEKILAQNSSSSTDSIIARLEVLNDESAWMRESRLSLIRKLSPLTRDKYRGLFIGSDNDLLGLINKVGKPLIINVSVIKDPYIRRLYTVLLLKNIFMHGINEGFRREVLIVIEEAQNLLGKDNPVGVIARMLAEIRKFGIGLILVSQSPSSLLEDAMKNTNTKIIHTLKSSLDLEIINKVLYLPPNIQKIIPYMDVGEAVLQSKTYKKPVVIRVV